MMTLTRAMDDLQSGYGYNYEFHLTQLELETLRNIIKSQWLYRLQLLKPEFVRTFNTHGIAGYHQVAHLIDHTQAWPTHARVLSSDATDFLKRTRFFQQLVSELGSIEIADEAKLGWPNLLWRLVRPGNSDCGPLHADKWFWDIATDWEIPNYPHERVNVWIAVHTELGKNGLLVVPNSHKRDDWKWHQEIRYNQIKPTFDEDLATLDLKLLPTEPGRIVMFNHKLIHGGAENLADTTRVSLEFTMLIPMQK